MPNPNNEQYNKRLLYLFLCIPNIITHACYNVGYNVGYSVGSRHDLSHRFASLIFSRGTAGKNKHVTMHRHPTHKRTSTDDDCALGSQARRPQPPTSLFRAFAQSEVSAARIYVAMPQEDRAGRHPKAVKDFVDHVAADNITREQLDEVEGGFRFYG